jgi:hypothetical protein
MILIINTITIKNKMNLNKPPSKLLLPKKPLEPEPLFKKNGIGINECLDPLL